MEIVFYYSITANQNSWPIWKVVEISNYWLLKYEAITMVDLVSWERVWQSQNVHRNLIEWTVVVYRPVRVGASLHKYSSQTNVWTCE